MSWIAVAALCGGAYALKIIGAFAARQSPEGTSTGSRLDILVVPVMAALIATQTLASGRHLVIDARLPALLLAAALISRRAPLLVVVLAAAGTAALLRHTLL